MIKLMVFSAALFFVAPGLAGDLSTEWHGDYQAYQPMCHPELGVQSVHLFDQNQYSYLVIKHTPEYARKVRRDQTRVKIVKGKSDYCYIVGDYNKCKTKVTDGLLDIKIKGKRCGHRLCHKYKERLLLEMASGNIFLFRGKRKAGVPQCLLQRVGE